LQEEVLIINPSSLILDLPDGFPLDVGDQQNVFNSFLCFQFMQWVILIVADLSDLKPFFGKDFFLILILINDLNSYLISWSEDIKR